MLGPKLPSVPQGESASGGSSSDCPLLIDQCINTTTRLLTHSGTLCKLNRPTSLLSRMSVRQSCHRLATLDGRWRCIPLAIWQVYTVLSHANNRRRRRIRFHFPLIPDPQSLSSPSPRFPPTHHAQLIPRYPRQPAGSAESLFQPRNRPFPVLARHAGRHPFRTFLSFPFLLLYLDGPL